MSNPSDMPFDYDSLSQVNKIAQAGAIMAAKKYAPEYGLIPENVNLAFESGDFVYKLERNKLDDSVITIVCGNDMRPTDPKEFGRLLREVLGFVSEQVKHKWVTMESINSRRKNIEETYDNMTKKQLVNDDRLVYRKFTTIQVIDKATKKSIRLTREIIPGIGPSIWDILKEAHILISQKVNG